MSPGRKHKDHLNTITKHFTTKPFVPRQINEKYVTSILNYLSYKCQVIIKQVVESFFHSTLDFLLLNVPGHFSFYLG